jgi:hypothetical protein
MDTEFNNENNVPFDQWTSCEFNGCNFVADEEDPTLVVCTDCGAWYRLELD